MNLGGTALSLLSGEASARDVTAPGASATPAATDAEAAPFRDLLARGGDDKKEAPATSGGPVDWIAAAIAPAPIAPPAVTIDPNGELHAPAAKELPGETGLAPALTPAVSAPAAAHGAIAMSANGEAITMSAKGNAIVSRASIDAALPNDAHHVTDDGAPRVAIARAPITLKAPLGASSRPVAAAPAKGARAPLDVHAADAPIASAPAPRARTLATAADSDDVSSPANRATRPDGLKARVRTTTLKRDTDDAPADPVAFSTTDATLLPLPMALTNAGGAAATDHDVTKTVSPAPTAEARSLSRAGDVAMVDHGVHLPSAMKETVAGDVASPDVAAIVASAPQEKAHAPRARGSNAQEATMSPAQLHPASRAEGAAEVAAADQPSSPAAPAEAASAGASAPAQSTSANGATVHARAVDPKRSPEATTTTRTIAGARVTRVGDAAPAAAASAAPARESVDAAVALKATIVTHDAIGVAGDKRLTTVSAPSAPAHPLDASAIESSAQIPAAVLSAVNHMALRRETTAQIDSAELGRIAVSARTAEGGGVDVRIAAERGETARVLTAYSGQIASEIRGADITLNQVTIHSGGASSGGFDRSHTSDDARRDARGDGDAHDSASQNPGAPRRVRIVL